jgi:hypothetical protein
MAKGKSQTIVVEPKGLHTNSSAQVAPEGSFKLAQNVYINKPGNIVSRRGFESIGQYEAQDPYYYSNRDNFLWNNKVQIFGINALTERYLLSNNSGGGWNNPQIFPTLNSTESITEANIDYGFRNLPLNTNTYFCSNAGLSKIIPDRTIVDDYSLITTSGVPEALDTLSVVLTNPTENTWFDDTKNVAYKLVYGYIDQDGRTILGTPSGRIEVTNNTGNPAIVTLRFQLPVQFYDTMSPFYDLTKIPIFYQLYRTKQSSVAVNDEMGLVYQDLLTTTDQTNEYLEIVDISPDSLIGETLYTSPSMEGILQSNFEAPYSNDVTFYKNCVLLSDTETKHNLFFTYLGGYTPGQNITLDYPSLTYTANFKEDVANKMFQVFGTFNQIGFYHTGVGTSVKIQYPGHNLQGGDSIVITNSNDITRLPNATYVINSVTYGEIDVTGPATTFGTGTCSVNYSDTGDAAINLRNTAKSFVYVFNDLNSTHLLYANYDSDYNELPGQIRVSSSYLTTGQFSFNASQPESFSPNLVTLYSTNDSGPNRVYYSKPQEYEAFPLLNWIPVGSNSSRIIRMAALRDSVFMFKEDGTVWQMLGEVPSEFRVREFDSSVKIFGIRSLTVLNNEIYVCSDQGVVVVSDTGIKLISYPIEDQLKSNVDGYPFYNVTEFNTLAYGVSYESERLYILAFKDRCWVYNQINDSWSTWDLGSLHSNAMSVASIARTAMIVDRNTNTLYLTKGYGIYTQLNTQTSSDYVDEQIGYDGGTNTVTYTDVPIVVDLLYNPFMGKNPGMMKKFSEFTFFTGDNLEDLQIYFTNSYVNIPMSHFGTGWGYGTFGGGNFGGGGFGNQSISRCTFPLQLMRTFWMSIGFRTTTTGQALNLTGLSVIYEVISTRMG